MEYKGDILKSVASNRKLGKGFNIIRKGKWKGKPMFSLTLEERATCPPTCIHWTDCYGNGMGFAHRFAAGPELESRLRFELAELARLYPGGFVIRLHILGDFYSAEYVGLWQYALVAYPNLLLFGYTARTPDTEIGFAVQFMNAMFPDRCWIRQSVSMASKPGLYATESPSSNSITCPQQLGKTQSCLTCGLCWAVNVPIHFINHDTNNKEKKHERAATAC